MQLASLAGLTSAAGELSSHCQFLVCMKGKGQSSPASPVQTFHTPTLPKGAESESLFIHSCQRHPQRIYAPKRHRVGWSRLVDTSQLPPLLGPRDGQVPLSSTLYQPEAEDSQLARKLRNHHIEVGKQTQTCGKLEPATFLLTSEAVEGEAASASTTLAVKALLGVWLHCTTQTLV